jgi:hypothetical protein
LARPAAPALQLITHWATGHPPYHLPCTCNVACCRRVPNPHQAGSAARLCFGGLTAPCCGGCVQVKCPQLTASQSHASLHSRASWQPCRSQVSKQQQASTATLVCAAVLHSEQRRNVRQLLHMH